MNGVFTVVLQDVHHEQVVGENHDLALGLIAFAVFVFLLHENPTTLAVGITLGRCWAQDFEHVLLDGLGLGWDVDFDFFRFGLNHDLTAQGERVGYLAKMYTPVTKAGVLAVELDAGVRPLDLGQLLLHPVLGVGVQVAQPDGRFHAVRARLGDAEPRTPQGFHALITGVLNVVPQLGAALASLGRLEDFLERRGAVLHELHAGRGSRRV